MKLVCLSAAAVALAIATPASADDPAACIQAYELTQTQRQASKLREAHAEAIKCSSEGCPAVLVKDCQKWLAEIDKQLASVVFEVKGGTGEALTAVKVTANGQPLVDKVDGNPVLLEAGSVTLHFEASDGKSKPADQTVVLKEGEKGHKVSVTLARASAPILDDKTIPLGVMVFGGAAVVAIGVGTIFAISGASKESDLDACRPSCPADDVNSVGTRYAIADILFSAGVVSAAAAAYMFLTRPVAAAPTLTGAPSRRRPGLTFEF